MPLDSDRMIDRRRLKRHLAIWRTLAVLFLIAFLVALLGDKGEFLRREAIARLTVEGFILSDRERDETLADIASDPETAALIVHIDSPGGTVVGGESLFHALRGVAEKKPVAVVMGEVAASAGYMSALAGDRIFAREATITGSIGVIWQTTDITGLLEKLGISAEAIKSGPLKAVPSPLEPLTPLVREASREMVLDIFHLFVDMVSERRNLSRPKVLSLADGRVFTGRQAVANHLVDEIGGEKEARAWLSQRYDIDSSLPVYELEIERDEELLESFFTSLKKAVLGKRVFPERVTLDGLISLWQAGGG